VQIKHTIILSRICIWKSETQNTLNFVQWALLQFKNGDSIRAGILYFLLQMKDTAIRAIHHIIFSLDINQIRNEKPVLLNSSVVG
jgi:hypothetical protein